MPYITFSPIFPLAVSEYKHIFLNTFRPYALNPTQTLSIPVSLLKPKFLFF